MCRQKSGQEEVKLHGMKPTWVFLIVKKKHILKHFNDNEPLISEECHKSHKVKIQRFDSL